MAEIILPPEEETPQAPELNIDKPTENSKVITIEFEAKKTNKVSTKDTNQQLYTTDTDAWFEFKETSLEGANGTYSVVFRNRHDGSIFQRTGAVVNGVAYYKIPHQEIRHAGKWRGQLVYTLENGNTTAREFGYDVKGHILDGKAVREIVVEDFETLMSQLRSMKDNAESELANLTQELRNATDTAEQNETDRQVFFDDLVEDIDGLQSNYQELLDTGVLQTNINTKLEALEEEYAPKLTEVTAQLAHIDNLKIGGGVQAGFENLNDELIQFIHDGTGGPIEIGSKPQDYSVTTMKPTFLQLGKNLFNKYTVEKGKRVNRNTGELFNAEGVSTSQPINVNELETYHRNYTDSYAIYNNAGGIIDGGVSTSENKTITMPLGASTIVLSVKDEYLSKFQFEKGYEKTKYEVYRGKLSEDITVGSGSLTDIPIEKMTFSYKTSNTKNILDREESLKSTILTGNGGAADNPSYDTSDYMYIGDANYISVSGTTNDSVPIRRFYVIYDRDFRPIESSDVGGDFRYSNPIKNVSGGVWLRVSYKATGENVQVEKGSSVTSYEPFDETYKIMQEVLPSTSETNSKTHPWNEKRVLFNGDSITHAGGNKSYVDFLTEKLNLDSVNYAIGGSTLAVNPDRPNDRNPLIERYQEMDNDADAVVIAITTNDWMYSWSELGNMSSRENTTTYGALHNLCLGLLEKYSVLETKILFVTPIKRNQRPFPNQEDVNSNGITLEEMGGIIKEVCGYYGIRVFDGYNEIPLNPHVDSQALIYFDEEGTEEAPLFTHPNNQGQEVIANTLEGYLNQV